MTTHSDNLPGFFRPKGDGQRSKEEHAATTEESTTGMTTTGGQNNQEPVVVWEAANAMEAQIVKGRLESEGIPAIVRGEALGSIYGLTTGNLAVTDVLVPAPLAQQAIDILNTDVDWDAEFEGDWEDQADDDGLDISEK
ncbi:MAG: DUF2007 domain-containing protein [Caldilineaceae bacterium]|nr:DUF2007 domain-containing protein [Caldilineaceae bacterium]